MYRSLKQTLKKTSIVRINSVHRSTLSIRLSFHHVEDEKIRVDYANHFCLLLKTYSIVNLLAAGPICKGPPQHISTISKPASSFKQTQSSITRYEITFSIPQHLNSNINIIDIKYPKRQHRSFVTRIYNISSIANSSKNHGLLHWYLWMALSRTFHCVSPLIAGELAMYSFQQTVKWVPGTQFRALGPKCGPFLGLSKYFILLYDDFKNLQFEQCLLNSVFKIISGG